MIDQGPDCQGATPERARAREPMVGSPPRRRALHQLLRSTALTTIGIIQSRTVLAREVASPSRFSLLPPETQWSASSMMSQGWRIQPVRGIDPTEFQLARPDGESVGRPAGPFLKMQVRASAAALVHALAPEARGPKRIDWHWRADAFPSGEPGDRSRDDFAARLYLLFDYPLDRVPWQQRWLIRAARAIHDSSLPAASLVYLLHDRPHPAAPLVSPYSDRVRMIVARAEARAGVWYAETRDVLADFQSAFGDEYGPGMPALRAVAVGADGDQTGARFTSWFGDVIVRGD
ncbi:MAG: hypothetical protein RL322_2554 [Pseudomonadota bacterium]